MAQFDRAIQTALKLIKKNGQEISWKQPTNSIPNPSQPWNQSTGSFTEYKPFICFLPLDKEGREFLTAIGGGEILSGSFYGLMGAVPFTPKKVDTVTRNGVVLHIENIDEISPNGQKVLYTIIFNG